MECLFGRVLALAKIQEIWKDIAESVKALIFFDISHQGTNIVNWGTYVSKRLTFVGIRSGKILGELGLWSEPVLDLNNMFRDEAAN